MVPELDGLLTREEAVLRETEILRDANIALTEHLSLDRILETLLDYLTKLIPYDSANVMLRRRDSQFFLSPPCDVTRVFRTLKTLAQSHSTATRIT